MKSKKELKEENKVLRHIIRQTFWMARRYAHGRSTYAPGTVRECYRVLKLRLPDLLPHKDSTIEPPDFKDTSFVAGDYLDDCNEDV